LQCPPTPFCFALAVSPVCPGDLLPYLVFPPWRARDRAPVGSDLKAGDGRLGSVPPCSRSRPPPETAPLPFKSPGSGLLGAAETTEYVHAPLFLPVNGYVFGYLFNLNVFPIVGQVVFGPRCALFKNGRAPSVHQTVQRASVIASAHHLKSGQCVLGGLSHGSTQPLGTGSVLPLLFNVFQMDPILVHLPP